MDKTKALPVNPALNTDTGLLKIIALVTLLIDHIGAVYFPAVTFLRIIGRVSFPLFAYCLVMGFLYTKNVGKYCLRLLIFGLVSEPFYLFAFYGYTPTIIFNYYRIEDSFLTAFLNIPLNIGFTLLLGLIGIYGIREKKYYLPIIALLLGYYGPIEYGFFGVGLVILMYLLLNAPVYLSVPLLGIFLWLAPLCSTATIDILGAKIAVQSFGIFVLPLLLIRTKTGIRLPRWLNYGFYPGHLVVITIINLLLER